MQIVAGLSRNRSMSMENFEKTEEDDPFADQLYDRKTRSPSQSHKSKSPSLLDKGSKKSRSPKEDKEKAVKILSHIGSKKDMKI